MNNRSPPSLFLVVPILIIGLLFVDLRYDIDSTGMVEYSRKLRLKESQSEVAGPSYMTLDGTQIPEGTPLLAAENHAQNRPALFNGYQGYPARCLFYPDHIECQLDDGSLVDEDYLVFHTTPVKDADVLNGTLTCGKICTDDNGRVVGHVSAEMTEWRKEHCIWELYGVPKCDTQPRLD